MKNLAKQILIYAVGIPAIALGAFTVIEGKRPPDSGTQVSGPGLSLWSNPCASASWLAGELLVENYKQLLEPRLVETYLNEPEQAGVIAAANLFSTSRMTITAETLIPDFTKILRNQSWFNGTLTLAENNLSVRLGVADGGKQQDGTWVCSVAATLSNGDSTVLNYTANLGPNNTVVANTVLVYSPTEAAVRKEIAAWEFLMDNPAEVDD